MFVVLVSVDVCVDLIGMVSSIDLVTTSSRVKLVLKLKLSFREVSLEVLKFVVSFFSSSLLRISSFMIFSLSSSSSLF